MKKLLLYASIVVALCPCLHAQEDSLSFSMLVCFYNTENLFDPENDSLTMDEAFTPDGLNHWGYKRYFHKINALAKVILAMGEGNPPTLIGLAEIENARVLQHLCTRSPLKKYAYRYVHHDSPDRRGIDVALLYRPDKITILQEFSIPVIFPFDPSSRNRDILYTAIQCPSGDTLHLFVNHWTSRYGGVGATIAKRNYYASRLRQQVDSIFFTQPDAAICIVGDLNDYPSDPSLRDSLRALNPQKTPKEKKELFNLMDNFSPWKNEGTHKQGAFWGCLDQCIVSTSLLTPRHPLQIENGQAEIFRAPFLLEDDEKYGGKKVYRTFLGPRYIGGYSDHLPIRVKIVATPPQNSFFAPE